MMPNVRGGDPRSPPKAGFVATGREHKEETATQVTSDGRSSSLH